MDMERLVRNNKASCEAAAHWVHVLEEKEHGAEKTKMVMKPGKHQRRKKEAEIGVSFTAFLLTYNRNKPVSFLLFC